MTKLLLLSPGYTAWRDPAGIKGRGGEAITSGSYHGRQCSRQLPKHSSESFRISNNQHHSHCTDTRSRSEGPGHTQKVLLVEQASEDLAMGTILHYLATAPALSVCPTIDPYGQHLGFSAHLGKIWENLNFTGAKWHPIRGREEPRAAEAEDPEPETPIAVTKMLSLTYKMIYAGDSD